MCGAAGMLGRAVVATARARGHATTPLSRAELDVADEDAVHAALAAVRPEVVVNCAAWTNVDGAEAEEAAAARANALGPGVLARACAQAGARLVHVSTDYVFDGAAPRDATNEPRPWHESDPVGPRSAYGRTKLAGERAVRAASADHAVVRTAWLFGPGARNFVDTMLGLAATREEVRVVTDQVGCPTFVGHLAPALVEIGERGLGGVLHVAGGGRCSWNELARETFAQAGEACRVQPALAADLARPAPRPAWSVLGSERADAPRLPPWRLGVRAHLEAVGRLPGGSTAGKLPLMRTIGGDGGRR